MICALTELLLHWIRFAVEQLRCEYYSESPIMYKVD